MSITIRAIPLGPGSNMGDLLPVDAFLTTDTFSYTINSILSTGLNNINSGQNSRVMGENCISSGLTSNAGGTASSATGDYSWSFGHTSTASGLNSFAFSGNSVGQNCISFFGNAYSDGCIAIGAAIAGNPSPAATDAIAIGTGAQALASQSISIGSSTCNDFNSISIGFGGGGTAASESVAIGSEAETYEINSIAIGRFAKTDFGATESIAIGSVATTTGAQTIVIGVGATTYSTGDIAFGISANAQGGYSTAIGRFANSTNYGEFALSGHDVHTRGATGFHQSGSFTYYNQNFNATANEIFLDGRVATSGSLRFLIPLKTSYKISITAIATQQTTGDTASFSGKGTIKNVAGTTSLLSAITMTQDDADGSMAATNVIVTADDTHDALAVAVTNTGLTVNWFVKVDYIEIVHI